MQVKLSNLIAPAFIKYYRAVINKEYRKYVSRGGRGSFKSFVNETLLAIILASNPTCELVCVREVYKDHRDSTFPGLIAAFERIGIPLIAGVNYPQGKTGALYIKLPNGAYVHFRGEITNGYEKIKGVRPTKANNFIGLIWFFEITEFGDDYGMNQVTSSLVRGKDKPFFQEFYEYNPHAKRSHWTYEWQKKMELRNDTFNIFTTYLSHTEELFKDWGGLAFWEEIQQIKEIDYDQYKNIYLGKPSALIGAIYDTYSPELHLKRQDTNEYKPQLVTIGVDTGEVDATVYTCVLISDGFTKVHVPKLWYHKNGESRGIMNINQRVTAFFEFAREVYFTYKKTIEVNVESADPTFIRLLKEMQMQKRIGYVIIKSVNKRKQDNKSVSAIHERISVTKILMGSNAITIDPSCSTLDKAFLDAEWDKKGNRLDDGTYSVDNLDSFEYAWLPYLKKIRDAVLRRNIKMKRTTPEPNKNYIN